MPVVPIIKVEGLMPEVREPIPPVGEAVLKVHSRCNLDCDYCYVYNLGDQSFLEQPKIMTQTTLNASADRIGQYIKEQGSPLNFSVVFHGGEPLLAPPAFYDEAAKTLRRAAGPKTVLDFELQTNGTLLSPEYLKVFKRHNIRVGVSLDGDRGANDLHRFDRKGRSSFDAVEKGLDLLVASRYHSVFAGILAVVDARNDPIHTYDKLRSYHPPTIDFLLPHSNWQTPPLGLETSKGRDATPYANWLSKIFDVWFDRDALELRIRTFDSIMYGLRGRSSTVESIGGAASSSLVVIETNGAFEMVDTLKSTPGRVAKTGLNVYQHSIEDANQYMARKAKQLGVTALPDDCISCPVVRQCGGGYPPHRYSSEGFNNRSVYCQDLSGLISHIYGQMASQTLQLSVLRHTSKLGRPAS